MKLEFILSTTNSQSGVNEGSHANMSDRSAAMPFTGERYVPEETGNIAVEHLHRYLVAANLVRHKVVLDIACGEGYGCAILSETAAHVTGVDIAEEAILHATDRYVKGNLNFLPGSCTSIPLGDSSVDCVVSFETIEHHDQHEEFMLEIKRVLKPDGFILISSPDKEFYSDQRAFTNPFHVKELYEADFQKLIKKHFTQHSFFSQRIVFGSLILPSKEPAPAHSFILSDGRVESFDGVPKPFYNLALASDSSLPAVNSGILEQPINDSEVIKSWEKVMAVRDGELNTIRSEYRALNSEFNQCQEALTRKAASKRVLFTIGVTFDEAPYGDYLKFQAFHLQTFMNFGMLLKRHGLEFCIVTHPDLLNYTSLSDMDLERVKPISRFDGHQGFAKILDEIDPDYHVVWNGHVEREVVKVSRSKGVRVIFCELGWLPQRDNFVADFNGVNGQTSLPYLPLLNEIVPAQYATWKDAFISQRTIVPLDVENFVFVPLQMENDENIISNSPFRSMSDFVLYLRSVISGTIVVRPHPSQQDVTLPDLPDVIIRRDQTIDSWIAASNYVVGINSTSLIEALIYDKIVYSCGLRFFPAHFGATLHFVPGDQTAFPNHHDNYTMNPGRKAIAEKMISYILWKYQIPRDCMITNDQVKNHPVLSQILGKSWLGNPPGK